MTIDLIPPLQKGFTSFEAYAVSGKPFKSKTSCGLPQNRLKQTLRCFPPFYSLWYKTLGWRPGAAACVRACVHECVRACGKLGAARPSSCERADGAITHRLDLPLNNYKQITSEQSNVLAFSTSLLFCTSEIQRLVAVKRKVKKKKILHSFSLHTPIYSIPRLRIPSFHSLLSLFASSVFKKKFWVCSCVCVCARVVRVNLKRRWIGLSDLLNWATLLWSQPPLDTLRFVLNKKLI